jgi:hypothetical protein
VKARIYSLVMATDMAKHKALTAAVRDELMPLISENGGSSNGGSVTIERPLSPPIYHTLCMTRLLAALVCSAKSITIGDLG